VSNTLPVNGSSLLDQYLMLRWETMLCSDMCDLYGAAWGGANLFGARLPIQPILSFSGKNGM
jgi:hypothetical protein